MCYFDLTVGVGGVVGVSPKKSCWLGNWRHLDGGGKTSLKISHMCTCGTFGLQYRIAVFVGVFLCNGIHSEQICGEKE